MILDSKSFTTSAKAERRPRLVRGDSQFRNKWILAISFLVIVLSLLLWGSPAVQQNIVDLFSDDEDRNVFRLLILFYSLFAILAIIPITIGIHLIHASRQILASNRFPAPGMKVLHDTWVIRGGRAQALAFIFILVAAMLIIGGISIPFYFHDLLSEILQAGQI